MKVLLIFPKYSEQVFGLARVIKNNISPIGIACIANVLEKKGHEVKIVDAEAENYDLKSLQTVIKNFQPQVVGISSTTAVFRKARETAKLIRETIPKTTVVIGGPHVASFVKETLEFEEFDYGVIGEGEITISELFDAIEGKMEICEVKGIVYKKNGKITVTPPRKPVGDLDTLPGPAWHLLPVEKYRDLTSRRGKVVSMISSRGCPYNCSFCDPDGKFGKKFRARSPENLVQEMQILYNKFNIREICFYDDIFTLDRKRIIGLCNILIRNNLDIIWECRTRVDCVDKEMLEKMCQAGCYRIRFGVESGNERVLGMLKKGITKEQIRDAFQWSKQVGIETIAYFMLGCPGDNKETMQETTDFAIELDSDYAIFSPTLTYNRNSDLFQWAVEYGFIDADYWTRYIRGEDLDPFPYLETDILTREDVKSATKTAYRKFYFRLSYVLNSIRNIDNLQQLKRYFLIFLGIVCKEF